MTFSPFKKWILIVFISCAWCSFAFAGPQGNPISSGTGFNCPAGGSIPCANVNTQSLFNRSVAAFSGGPYGGLNLTCWSIRNTSGFDVFVPTATDAEFEAFLWAATGQDSSLASLGVSAEPCCNPANCAAHGNPGASCSACILEGNVGDGNCCDWACAAINDTTTLLGNSCCQITAAPDPGETLVGGVCVNTCGDNTCDPWEDNTNCCEDCNVLGDGFCCAADGETLVTACQDCPGAPACGDGQCCGASGENASNCSDCAVCPDTTCTNPPENTTNCCDDCDTGCGDTSCCAAIGETTATCAADCGSSCGDTACNGSETLQNCCEDCAGSPACGDGECCAATGETTATCAADCGSSCGDGTCNGGETLSSCCEDCAGSPACGDGECCAATGETIATCSGDCALDCTSPPYTNGAVGSRCTISVSSNHGDTNVAGTCDEEGGPCDADCNNGSMTSWTNPCNPFDCTGTIPSDATPCSGDSTGLSADTSRTVSGDGSGTCGAPKCEYYCNSGYTKSGNTCIPTSSNCNSPPYTNGSGSSQCTISVSSNDGDTNVGGSCPFSGSCDADCNNGSMTNWNNTCVKDCQNVGSSCTSGAQCGADGQCTTVVSEDFGDCEATKYDLEPGLPGCTLGNCTYTLAGRDVSQDVPDSCQTVSECPPNFPQSCSVPSDCDSSIWTYTCENYVAPQKECTCP